MKQGTGSSNSGAHKREPMTKAISPKAVSEIGVHQVHPGGKPALNQGRGFTGPKPNSTTSHKSGSQGKR